MKILCYLTNNDLNWLTDVEYYKRLYIKYGLPHIIEDICVINRDSAVRTTNMLTEARKQEEVQRVIKMYEEA